MATDPPIPAAPAHLAGAVPVPGLRTIAGLGQPPSPTRSFRLPAIRHELRNIAIVAHVNHGDPSPRCRSKRGHLETPT